jgi:integrase/recombinase XerD
MKTCLQFPELLQAFFTDHLMHQRQASPHTIASYRDTFRLLLHFVHQQTGEPPTKVAMESFGPPFLSAFLNHLENERSVSVRSRNVRLAALHSFFSYVTFSEPAYSGLAQRVLAIPNKRFDRRCIEYLTQPEIEALLSAPDRTTWGGRRDGTLLLVAAQTGLRISELIGLRRGDLALGTGGSVRCLGKGRKENAPRPLERMWWPLCAFGCGNAPALQKILCSPAQGVARSAAAVERLLAKHLAVARTYCASLAKKHVTMHVLRHSKAMDLLQHGVERSVIAPWLGHESIETTDVYLHADMAMKEKALAKTAPHNGRNGRYRPDDRLLAFLKSL